MAMLPRVLQRTREEVAREFDDLGPDTCMRQISATLLIENPELLDMAAKWARDVGHAAPLLAGFCFFYRVLHVEARSADALTDGGLVFGGLPRVTPETREAIFRQIDVDGSDAFSRAALDDLDRSNPELLRAAHHVASEHPHYLRAMQGFALLYACLRVQSVLDRESPR